MDVKKRLSLIIIVLVNIAFFIKYLERSTPYYIPLAVLYAILYLPLYSCRNAVRSSEWLNKTISLGLILAYFVFSVFLFYKIPQESLNVDRYSVISSFWECFFKAEYVYSAKSHLGNLPGPMPFYFILALPFYLTGELGYFSLCGLLVFALLLYYSRVDSKAQLSGILLLVSSAFYLWEVIARSNLFLNSSLILFSIVFFMASLEWKRQYHILLQGIVIGLLLSTRNVLIIPYIVLFLYSFKNHIYKLLDFIKIGLVAALAFCLTFIPFVLNHFSAFLEVNPFIIQSSFLMPTELSLVCIGITFSSYYFVRKMDDVYFYGGIFLFLCIFVYFLYQCIVHGFQSAFFGSRADISYFILCTPFLLFFLLNEQKGSAEKKNRPDEIA